MVSGFIVSLILSELDQGFVGCLKGVIAVDNGSQGLGLSE